jgi:hypothetical protein
MAIRNIKEIIYNKGYVINPSDRRIFEEEDLQSFFGLSVTDVIEFIIYDVNDNQLPQYNGELVRYIPLNTQNINDYFLVPEGTVFQKYQLPKEYFIDVERLLMEAGYSNGIFKTQVTLINNRCGSDAEFNKLWISEISPSRTEVRLFPLKQGVELYEDLQSRYNIFVNGGEFREDTLQSIYRFLEKVTPTTVLEIMISTYGKVWVEKLTIEFGINGFDEFLTNIHNIFIKSAIYEFTNRISNINDINYGKLKETPPPIELSKSQIFSSTKLILATILEKYLPQQNIQLETLTDDVFDSSIDPVYDILQSYESDLKIDYSPVVINETIVLHDGDVEQAVKIDKVINDIGDGVKPKIITHDDIPEYTPSISYEINNAVETISGGGGVQNSGEIIDGRLVRPEFVNEVRDTIAQQ